ncbi:DUF4395 family protein [Peribacillus muralis]|uniref:DUF4395 family protein n=1 Tax=Peribacillus muralis TaxID=264697 RepID=UPI003CFEA220
MPFRSSLCFQPDYLPGIALFEKRTSEYIQKEHSPQQFNQLIAFVCLGAGLISFLLGWTVIGYLFTLMVGIASLTAIAGFFICCFILYQWE